MNRRRSKSSSEEMPAPRPMKTCRWNGSVAAMSGAFDSEELSTGTSRKPISTWPSAATTSRTIFSQCARSAASCGMNMKPQRTDLPLAIRCPVPPFLAEERVGNLNKQTGTVTHQRISADSAAVGQVFQHEQAVLHDLVRLDALHGCAQNRRRRRHVRCAGHRGPGQAEVRRFSRFWQHGSVRRSKFPSRQMASKSSSSYPSFSCP
jgi:hypothetical protein